jgi:hypothetical protein
MADAVAQGSDPVSMGRSQAAAAEGQPAYSGKLLKGTEPGTVQGWLIDRLGCRIHFRGELESRKGAGYVLTSTHVYIPKSLQVEVIDGQTGGNDGT